MGGNREDQNLDAGGKAKPLKAPKKEKKEMDEDDLAYKAKLKAGMKYPEQPRTAMVTLSTLQRLTRPQMPRRTKRWLRRPKAKVP
ncbi:MAG: hypothetical protein Q9191_002211 [Dirinaria sp. TL-2023a]